MVISQYFTVLVLDHQYWVLDQIISESICLKLSQCQPFDAQCIPYILHPPELETWPGFVPSAKVVRARVHLQKNLASVSTALEMMIYNIEKLLYACKSLHFTANT
jgi:hypothetical protein